MMSLLERTKSNFFWGGCGMNVGEWRFVVIFNLFSNVSGCHKIAEFICECPQSFDIFKRHVSKYFFFLVGGFNLTLKVKFCQKLKVRKNSSHIFCCFPKFLLRHQRFMQIWMIFLPPLWLKISTRFLLLTFDLKLGTSVQWDWDLPWWALDVLVHLPSPAEMCRFGSTARAVFFFFRFGFVVCLAMIALLRFICNIMWNMDEIMRDSQVFQGLHSQFTILAYYIPNPGL